MVQCALDSSIHVDQSVLMDEAKLYEQLTNDEQLSTPLRQGKQNAVKQWLS
jgi:hypothetical protein